MSTCCIALYGCETWFSLTTNNILLLERAHRFCIKYLQGLSTRTRTDAALSLLGTFSIESEIDFRKLILFGQFCRNNMKCWVFECFYRRLASFVMNKETQTGYFADIHRIMIKYGLLEYFESYIRSNILPSKNIWKRLVKGRIHEMRLVPGSIECLLPSLIVSDSCTLIIVHTLYGSNQRNPVTYQRSVDLVCK